MGDFLEFLLIAIPMTAVIGTPFYLVRRKINTLQQELAEERGQNTTAKIATEKSALEERVRVLERIVTSRGYTVAEEIEDLRHTPSIPSDAGVPLNAKSKEVHS